MTTPTKMVSGAELKATLNALNLSPAWFASRVGVAMRTIVRWFDEPLVSDSTAFALERVVESADAEVDKIVAEAGEQDPVVLQTYRTDKGLHDGQWPAAWHRMVTYRAAQQLRAIGHDVRVEYR